MRNYIQKEANLNVYNKSGKLVTNLNETSQISSKVE